MSIFEMIKYHSKVYPANIPLRTEEVACNFDTLSITPHIEYSLHTEYSYAKRKYRNKLLSKYNHITSAHKYDIPMLWTDIKWATEFAEFIIEMTNLLHAPQYIEIHPPYSDYTDGQETFLDRYRVFEEIILETYPDTQILIENRCGSLYKGGKFILSDINSIKTLVSIIDKKNLSLRVTLDIPQLYTAHNVRTSETDLITKLLHETIEIREYIKGLHLWGKKTSESGRRIAHVGNLDTYFYNNKQVKNEFLNSLFNLFNDNQLRNMVLEVNSGNDDLYSIVDDLLKAGISFV